MSEEKAAEITRRLTAVETILHRLLAVEMTGRRAALIMQLAALEDGMGRERTIPRKKDRDEN